MNNFSKILSFKRKSLSQLRFNVGRVNISAQLNVGHFVNFIDEKKESTVDDRMLFSLQTIERESRIFVDYVKQIEKHFVSSSVEL